MQMSRRVHYNANHAYNSNSNASDNRFTTMLEVFTDSQKSQKENMTKKREAQTNFAQQQADQQAKINKENA